MRTMNRHVIQNAQEFAARWGFLTRDIFYDFLCSMSPTQNYRYWNYLLDEGYFVRSLASHDVLLLGGKSRRASFGKSARPSRLPVYVEHDAVVARFLLTLDRLDLIARYWLEDELTRRPVEAFQILGAERMHRIPDLIFDLKAANGLVRCAFEAEKTTKSQSRYDRIALAYLDYPKVKVILFGCGSRATEAAVRRSFDGRLYAKKKRVPGIFQYGDFAKDGLQSTIRFGPMEYTVERFLEIVTKQSLLAPASKRNLNEKSISFRNPTDGEAA